MKFWAEICLFIEVDCYGLHISQHCKRLGQNRRAICCAISLGSKKEKDLQYCTFERGRVEGRAAKK